MQYQDFINSKRHTANEYGFEPLWMPERMFDFQRHIAEKALRRGRMGIFADTGLGKSAIALTIAQNIAMKTNGRTLILTPLAVAFQFLKEAEAIGVDDIEHTKDGIFSKKIVICNYERLHYLNPDDFICVICDESSILKNFLGKTKAQITAFVKKMPYRYLQTATPAPNDFTEIGTSSEALGEMGHMDMLQKFFKSTENQHDSRKTKIGVKYYLKPHAERSFFEWLNTWSMMVRKPSDIGYSDERYFLPQLIENTHIVKSYNTVDENGQMLLMPIIAKQFHEIKYEQRTTQRERCEMAVELAAGKASVYWCNTNEESKLLRTLDRDAKEIIGSQTIDQKEEILKAFIDGGIDRIITKSSITGTGLNLQHVNHSVFFPTFSYEQYYQSVRRFWRFGQTRDVTIDLIISEGQLRVMEALEEKKAKAQELYENLLSAINADYSMQYADESIKFMKPLFAS